MRHVEFVPRLKISRQMVGVRQVLQLEHTNGGKDLIMLARCQSDFKLILTQPDRVFELGAVGGSSLPVGFTVQKKQVVVAWSDGMLQQYQLERECTAPKVVQTRVAVQAICSTESHLILVAQSSIQMLSTVQNVKSVQSPHDFGDVLSCAVHGKSVYVVEHLQNDTVRVVSLALDAIGQRGVAFSAAQGQNVTIITPCVPVSIASVPYGSPEKTKRFLANGALYSGRDELIFSDHNALYVVSVVACKTEAISFQVVPGRVPLALYCVADNMAVLFTLDKDGKHMLELHRFSTQGITFQQKKHKSLYFQDIAVAALIGSAPVQCFGAAAQCILLNNETLFVARQREDIQHDLECTVRYALGATNYQIDGGISMSYTPVDAIELFGILRGKPVSAPLFMLQQLAAIQKDLSIQQFVAALCNILQNPLQKEQLTQIEGLIKQMQFFDAEVDFQQMALLLSAIQRRFNIATHDGIYKAAVRALSWLYRETPNEACKNTLLGHFKFCVDFLGQQYHERRQKQLDEGKSGPLAAVQLESELLKPGFVFCAGIIDIVEAFAALGQVAEIEVALETASDFVKIFVKKHFGLQVRTAHEPEDISATAHAQREYLMESSCQLVVSELVALIESYDTQDFIQETARLAAVISDLEDQALYKLIERVAGIAQLSTQKDIQILFVNAMCTLWARNPGHHFPKYLLDRLNECLKNCISQQLLLGILIQQNQQNLLVQHCLLKDNTISALILLASESDISCVERLESICQIVETLQLNQIDIQENWDRLQPLWNVFLYIYDSVRQDQKARALFSERFIKKPTLFQRMLIRNVFEYGQLGLLKELDLDEAFWVDAWDKNFALAF